MFSHTALPSKRPVYLNILVIEVLTVSFAAAGNTPFSILLVNYKSLELTQACLTLLRDGLQGAEVAVYVVDNDSNDASTEYLRTLDWITLIERKPAGPEAGSDAHGRALDMALGEVETEFVFLLHTDTFIYDSSVFAMMLAAGTRQPGVAAVGCVEQLNRGLPRSLWRLTSRFAKHYFRRTARLLGLPGRDPKPYRETYLKSFCTLWNVRLMRQHRLHFAMDERNPGYELQERMVALGYTIKRLSPARLFSYLDHVESGTVCAQGGYGTDHRREKSYREQVAAYRTPPLAPRTAHHR